jgi:hypothetical protein
MLREVVAEEARGVGLLQELQPIGVQLLQRGVLTVDPIEQPELYSSHRASSAGADERGPPKR